MRESVRELFVGQGTREVGRPRRRQQLASTFSGITLTDLTTGGSAHTKGSYGQITAAASIDADGFWLQLIAGSASNDYLFDLAIGGAGSEVNILSNLLLCCSGFGVFESWDVYVPLPIKRGTRIAGRAQSTLASQNFRAGLTLCKGPMYRAMRQRRAVTYGANTADSGGQAIDPGGSANAKGSYAQLSAAITNPIRYAILCHGNVRNGARTDYTALLDLAVGAAASEVVVAGNMYLRLESASDMVRPALRGRWLDIERGSRLAARASCSGTDATDRLTDLVVIGFD